MSLPGFTAAAAFGRTSQRGRRVIVARKAVDGPVLPAAVWQVDDMIVCCEPCGSLIGPGIYEPCCDVCGKALAPSSSTTPILLSR